MEKSRKALLIAILVFVISFFLPAIWLPKVSPPTMRGYWCAYVTLVSPWTSDGLKDLPAEPVQYFAILFSGLINPVFLLTITSLHRGQLQKLGRILRIVLLLMLPACWVVFFQEHVYPFIGYFVWTAAMLLALFSTSFSSGRFRHAASAGSTTQ